MSMTRHALALALSLWIALALAALSRLPYDATTRAVGVFGVAGDTDSPAMASGSEATAPVADDVGALIRLSWRTTSERVEECRRLSEEELAALPVHMRREEVCEGRMLPYRLRVTLDDRTIIDEIVQPAGARGDRPLYVFRELAIPSGERVLTALWEREAADRVGNGATPASLGIRAVLSLEPRDVALITYDLDQRALVALGRGVVDFESTSGTAASQAFEEPQPPGPRSRGLDDDHDETPDDGRKI